MCCYILEAKLTVVVFYSTRPTRSRKSVACETHFTPDLALVVHPEDVGALVEVLDDMSDAQAVIPGDRLLSLLHTRRQLGKSELIPVQSAERK